MKKQITRISPFQTAKVMAILYFVISLPLIAFMGLMFSFVPGPKPPMMGGMIFVLPFFYLVFGFIFTIIATWIYNFVAKLAGGIEFTMSEIDDIE
ncbi:MAG TPA: hypothetical protein VFW00_01490 [Rhodocyclaceae bacterium]|nr:hypothetical protein [Rhodocyclaceae bacterium]